MKCSDDVDCIRKCAKHRPSIADLPDLPKRCDLRNYYWTLDDPYAHDPPEDMDFWIWLKRGLDNAIECGQTEECTQVCEEMYDRHKEKAECKEVLVIYR